MCKLIRIVALDSIREVELFQRKYSIEIQGDFTSQDDEIYIYIYWHIIIELEYHSTLCMFQTGLKD